MQAGACAVALAVQQLEQRMLQASLGQAAAETTAKMQAEVLALRRAVASRMQLQRRGELGGHANRHSTADWSWHCSRAGFDISDV